MAREQYLDFLKCRRFRQTLLCHADVPLDLSPKPSLLTRFYVSSAARPVSEEPNLSSTSIEKFQGKRSASMETDFPLAKAAVLILGQVWPQVLHFPELLARVRVRLGIHSTPGQELVDQEALALCEILLKTYGTGLLDLHLYAPRYASEVSQRPTASPLARWQIQQGDVVANLCHTSVVVEDELGRHLLSLLDGARDRSALLEAMLEFAASRSATAADNQAVPDRAHARKILGEQLDRNLQKLARMALLVA
jgi:methyltransferase-like protein